ncbi:hypothetical protein VKT23_018406 [Stygiomarasmius scandens]|uniref:Uncharacterized protein n=1 Tax=Marasmiellus scandens TaxID=2682957 RepID=A0ABR1IS39_9AGAR
MASGYWQLFILLYSPIAWAMQLVTSESTVTSGQSATVTWSLDDNEKANSALGILVVFEGENPQDVANELANSGQWGDNIAYSPIGGKSSPSGSLTLQIPHPGNFYFGGYILVQSLNQRDGSSDHSVSLSEIGRSPPMTAVSPDSSQIPSHPGSETGTPTTSGGSSTPALPSASANSTQEETATTNGIASQFTPTGAPAASEPSLGQVVLLQADLLNKGLEYG